MLREDDEEVFQIVPKRRSSSRMRGSNAEQAYQSRLAVYRRVHGDQGPPGTLTYSGDFGIGYYEHAVDSRIVSTAIDFNDKWTRYGRWVVIIALSSHRY